MANLQKQQLPLSPFSTFNKKSSSLVSRKGTRRSFSTLTLALFIVISFHLILFWGMSTAEAKPYNKGRTRRNAEAAESATAAASTAPIPPGIGAGQQPVCGATIPCGWEVYREVNKQIRTSNYFVFSPCKCPDSFKCVRDSDNVSINSYVHRCKPADYNGTAVGTVTETKKKK